MLNVISTGSRALDKIIGGGIRLGMLTDIFGPSGSGKTQLCFQLCINCAKPSKMKGLDASVLFVDTTNTFRPERIVSMARHSDLDEKVLDKIYLHKVYSTADQMATVERASRLHNLKLVIVDSVSDLFSFEYKQSLSAERHMKFMRLMRELALLAINSNSAVVVTNNIRFADGAQREYLDKSISSFAHMRVEISRADHLFRARLLRPSLDPCSALYSISEKGIADV